MDRYCEADLERVKFLLPEPVLRIAELIGFPAAAQLLKVLGGATFPVGKGIRALGIQRVRMLQDAIGKENARILMNHFGGEVLYLPRCTQALRELRNRRFIDEFNALRGNGVSSVRAMTKLCPKYGFSDRFAWGLLAKQKAVISSDQ